MSGPLTLLTIRMYMGFVILDLSFKGFLGTLNLLDMSQVNATIPISIACPIQSNLVFLA
jgi:hypothetical protein